MDFGDLIFILIVGFGLLTQLVGGKKRRAPVRRPPAGPSAQERTGAHSDPVPAKIETKRTESKSYMERLLRELELDELIEKKDVPSTTARSEPEPTPSGALDVAARDSARSWDQRRPSLPTKPMDRPLPAAGGESIETLEPAGGASHVRFHEKYLSGPEKRPTLQRPRVAELLNPKSLRQAVLLKEILGPPKAS